MKLTTILSNVGILTRAVFMDKQSLTEKERKDLENSFKSFTAKGVEHEVIGERNGVKRKVF